MIELDQPLQHEFWISSILEMIELDQTLQHDFLISSILEMIEVDQPLQHDFLDQNNVHDLPQTGKSSMQKSVRYRRRCNPRELVVRIIHSVIQRQQESFTQTAL